MHANNKNTFLQTEKQKQSHTDAIKQQHAEVSGEISICSQRWTMKTTLALTPYKLVMKVIPPNANHD